MQNESFPITTVETDKNVMKETSDVLKTSGPENEVITSLTNSFREQLNTALGQEKISAIEHTWWLEQGINSIIRDIKNPQEALQALQELMNAFEQNIVINQQKKEVLHKIDSTLISNKNISAGEKSMWREKIEKIQNDYSDRKIFLAESFQKLQQIDETLEGIHASEKKSLPSLYEGVIKVWQRINTNDALGNLSIYQQETFNNLSFSEKTNHLQQLHEQIEKMFSDFIQKYPTYAAISNLPAKWSQSTCLISKIKLLSSAKKNMKKGTEDREKEIHGIQLLIDHKNLEEAKKQLLVLKKNLHPDTYNFFGFSKELDRIHTMDKIKNQFLVSISRFEEAQHHQEAIDLLSKVADVCDIQELPSLRERITLLKTKKMITEKQNQIQQLRQEGKKKEAEQLEEELQTIDPTLQTMTLSNVQKPTNPIEELMTSLRGKQGFKGILAERKLLTTIEKKQRARGKSLDKKDISITERIKSESIDRSKKEQKKEQLQRHSVSFHEQESIENRRKNIRLVLTGKHNNAGTIEQVSRDITEDKRAVGTIDIQRSEQSENAVSNMSEAQNILEEKMKQYLTPRVKEMETKFGIIIPITPDFLQTIEQSIA